MISRFFTLAGAVICFALAIPICAQAAQTVSIGYQPIVNGPLYIARHEHYFRKSGLNVRWVKFTSGPAQFAALQGGRIDVAWGGIGTFLGVYANGADIRLLAVLEDYNPVEGIVVSPKSSITSIPELSGKTVALVKGSDGHYGLIKALQMHHMRISSVKILNMEPPQQVAALLNGNVTAVSTWAPFLEQLTDRGYRVIFRNSDLKAGPGLLGWVAKRKWLKTHEGIPQKLLEGWEKGYQAMKNHPDWAAKFSSQYTGMKLSQAAEIQKRLIYYRATGMLTPSSPVYWSPDSPIHVMLRDFVSFGIQNGVMKKKPDIDTYVDTRFESQYESQTR